MTLYELTAEYSSLLDAIEAGEIPEEAIADTLEAVEGEFYAKCDNVACAIKNLLAEAEMIRAEEKKLKARREAKEKSAARLKDYLDNALKNTGKDKFETARAAGSYRKSVGVVVDDAFYLWAKRHKEFLKIADPTPDKIAIKEALDAGKSVKGASLETRYNLIIR